MPSSLAPRSIRWLAGLLVGLASATCLAGPTQPQHQPDQWVQVIVFRSLDQAAGRHEHWGHTLPGGAPAAGVNLEAHSGRPQGFHRAHLGPRMERIWNILRAAALYHPMLKAAWIQPSYPIGSAIPVELDYPPGHGSRKQGLPGRMDPGQPPPLPGGASAPSRHTRYRLLGSVQITVMRHVYIEVHTALIKRNPRAGLLLHPAGESGHPSRGKARLHRMTVYPINQAGKFRPGRVSYFDNPVYGILVYVKAVPRPMSTIPLAKGG